MKTVGAVLEFVGKVSDEVQPGYVAFQTRLDLPDGKTFEVKFVKDASGKYRAKVPTVLTYVDTLRKVRAVAHENYARFLLESYGPKARNPQNRLLKFVEEIKEAEVAIPVFEEAEEPKAVEPPEVPVGPTVEVAEAEVPKKKGKKQDEKP